MRETRFSQRDSVGCEAVRGYRFPASDHAAVREGSWRKVFVVGVFIAFQAICNTRCLRRSCWVKLTCRAHVVRQHGGERSRETELLIRVFAQDQIGIGRQRPPAKSRSTALSPPVPVAAGALSAGIASIPERVYALGLDAFMWCTP